FEDAVGDGDVTDVARHLAADDHPAMAPQHRAVGDHVVLRRGSGQPARAVLARLDGDAVVAHRNMAVGDMYVPARLRIDTVRVGRRRVVDGGRSDVSVFAGLRIYPPERRGGDG